MVKSNAASRAGINDSVVKYLYIHYGKSGHPLQSVW